MPNQISKTTIHGPHPKTTILWSDSLHIKALPYLQLTRRRLMPTCATLIQTTKQFGKYENSLYYTKYQDITHS